MKPGPLQKVSVGLNGDLYYSANRGGGQMRLRVCSVAFHFQGHLHAFQHPNIPPQQAFQVSKTDFRLSSIHAVTSPDPDCRLTNILGPSPIPIQDIAFQYWFDGPTDPEPEARPDELFTVVCGDTTPGALVSN